MKKQLLAFVLFTAIALSLAGCGKARADETAVQAVSPNGAAGVQAPAVEAVQSAASAENAGRRDGERFEDVIILEGMEETVRYEHARDDALGFEIDYDYESLLRRRESDRECFISIYDDPDNPENYLEVRYSPETVDAACASISEMLSKDYDIIKDSFTLDRAGSCIRIDASNAVGNGGTPDLLQKVYIIPAADGSRVAAAHYSFESAEGFGRRFTYIMNTMAVIDRNGERKLSDEQALSAIRTYCLMGNPELEDIVNAGEYQVYWAVSSSDDDETVVLFRSYTGALIRYYIDRVTGEAYVTESVSGAAPEETRTGESLNVWNYIS